MVDSSWSERSSISGSDHSDFETSMKGENNDRAYKPVFLNQAWRFEPPERIEKRTGESGKHFYVRNLKNSVCILKTLKIANPIR